MQVIITFIQPKFIYLKPVWSCLMFPVVCFLLKYFCNKILIWNDIFQAQYTQVEIVTKKDNRVEIKVLESRLGDDAMKTLFNG